MIVQFVIQSLVKEEQAHNNKNDKGVLLDSIFQVVKYRLFHVLGGRGYGGSQEK